MLLAIDTSTIQTGLACYDEHGLLGECTWQSGRDHSAQLLPQLSLLLRHLGRTRDDISAVAVALGPGSWSGLRVGMSTAKGFALARSVPVIGVGTLDALVYQHERPGLTTIPLIRLGRERYASGTPPPHGGRRRSIQPRNVTLVEIAAETTGRALFCGDVDLDVQAALRERLGARALFPTPAASARRPGYLAEVAWQRLQAGDTDNPATLEPIYLGQPVRTKPLAS
ncbi:MAG TPA: tRNA (adenosine(37)-N6)-threonylcarbamoyltransferase complex dimerization subunit type 1 TsaB [Roseiflexaceae bacterium]|nr:tRNA (adenosine(37)-N6)-threonylcarbamoyltransferase complex dimerization subunit type 1 TsaB [Roseiflexaceae bacterium]